MHVGYWWENQKERVYSEDLDAGGYMDLREIRWRGMHWMDVVQDGTSRRLL
jgi:hypothetical protein